MKVILTLLLCLFSNLVAAEEVRLIPSTFAWDSQWSWVTEKHLTFPVSITRESHRCFISFDRSHLKPTDTVQVQVIADGSIWLGLGITGERTVLKVGEETLDARYSEGAFPCEGLNYKRGIHIEVTSLQPISGTLSFAVR